KRLIPQVVLRRHARWSQIPDPRLFDALQGWGHALSLGLQIVPSVVSRYGVCVARQRLKAAVITPSSPKLTEASYAQCVLRSDTGDHCTPAWRRDRALQAGPPEPRLPR